MTYEIKTSVPISERVAFYLQAVVMNGETPVRIWFSVHGYQRAREEQESLARFAGVAEHCMGDPAPMTYMGYPYSIGPLRQPSQDRDFFIDTAEAQERRKPPPPTEREIADDIMDSCLRGIDEFGYPHEQIGEIGVEPYLRRLIQRVNMRGHQFRIIVEPV